MKKILPDQIVIFWRKGKGVRSLSQICLPLAQTQASKCAGHWSTVPSISNCSRLHHTAAGYAWSATSCKKIK